MFPLSSYIVCCPVHSGFRSPLVVWCQEMPVPPRGCLCRDAAQSPREEQGTNSEALPAPDTAPCPMLSRWPGAAQVVFSEWLNLREATRGCPRAISTQVQEQKVRTAPSQNTHIRNISHIGKLREGVENMGAFGKQALVSQAQGSRSCQGLPGTSLASCLEPAHLEEPLAVCDWPWVSNLSSWPGASGILPLTPSAEPPGNDPGLGACWVCGRLTSNGGTR